MYSSLTVYLYLINQEKKILVLLVVRSIETTLHEVHERTHSDFKYYSRSIYIHVYL